MIYYNNDNNKETSTHKFSSLEKSNLNWRSATHMADEENKAAWLLVVKTLKILPYHLPPLGENGVKVRIKAVGICGSDVHHFKTMRCANFIVKKPMVIGLKSLAIGDRVALEPGISCQRCNFCKVGRYNLCSEMKFFGSPATNGSLANQVVHPANLCFKLPNNVSLEEGAMCEPLSAGVHACRPGPIGLITLLAARAFGAPRVVIVDVDDSGLSLAKDLGAYDILQVSTDIQVDVIGIFRYRNTWPLCIEFLRTGKIDVKPLITHRFGFSQEDIEEAFKTSARGGEAIKVMFNL
ncbi:hypothetical protein K2173_026666 [Erythroxylum novogranatense]|uniref:Alcohol dehydrogenase-like N-terminal domain-containing protein n=1 Tax=Erythroxylum novogranatense TaxID=1862640 RepID=A0AAV8TZR0_9ROSI|nr:hypothetical protein K2173_026666 [Erythroxylum novogranatense]